MSSFHLQIVTPDGLFYDGEAESLDAVSYTHLDVYKRQGMQGKYVPLKETIRGFKEIIEGKHDDLPESAFLFAGTIDDVLEKAKTL